MSQKQYKIDAVLDLILIRYVYKELDHEFTVQDLIKDPRYVSRLKDPPGKSAGHTINGGASGIVSRMTEMGLLLNVTSKKLHGGTNRRVYRINRALLNVLFIYAGASRIDLFDGVKQYYNACRTFKKKEYGDRLFEMGDEE